MTTADLESFLAHFRPDGYTTFVAIVPDGNTVAETFNGTDPSKAAAWIETQNRARGIYFTVNPTPAGLRKKPTKADIAAIAGIWADVDPADGNRIPGPPSLSPGSNFGNDGSWYRLSDMPTEGHARYSAALDLESALRVTVG
jgi:hypothetical protein